MIRFLLRLLGFLVLAAGFVALVVDGARSIAAGVLSLTPTAQSWAQFSPDTLESVKRFVAELGVPTLENPVLSSILASPTFAPLIVVGVLLMLIGRRPRRRVGVEP
ncbi:hypothetical protein ACFSCV_10630 [Methylopila henanensis]|uniref:PetM family of cytochrome b6f complex subunit 7 n=1 Tax=Methylopila henanensis TaxID=873516 RepID=A0ABW4K5K8_9HYPH